jgi:hypothetical protein
MKIIRAVLAPALCGVFGQAGNAADDPGPVDPPPLAPPISAPVYSWAGIYMKGSSPPLLPCARNICICRPSMIPGRYLGPR